MKPTRDDLRYLADRVGTYAQRLTEVSDADLAAMGLVQAPECGECGGEGIEPWDGGEDSWVLGTKPCLKCGGSGYGRMVSLDVDADRLRLALSRWDDVDANYITGVARQVLAALDGEQQVHASYCMEGPNHPGECRP